MEGGEVSRHLQLSVVTVFNARPGCAGAHGRVTRHLSEGGLRRSNDVDTERKDEQELRRPGDLDRRFPPRKTPPAKFLN